jgi:hypothetical protein
MEQARNYRICKLSTRPLSLMDGVLDGRDAPNASGVSAESHRSPCYAVPSARRS